MSFWSKFPFTNEHNLNLDWILGKWRELDDAVQDILTKLKGLFYINKDNINTSGSIAYDKTTLNKTGLVTSNGNNTTKVYSTGVEVDDLSQKKHAEINDYSVQVGFRDRPDDPRPHASLTESKLMFNNDTTYYAADGLKIESFDNTLQYGINGKAMLSTADGSSDWSWDKITFGTTSFGKDRIELGTGGDAMFISPDGLNLPHAKYLNRSFQLWENESGGVRSGNGLSYDVGLGEFFISADDSILNYNSGTKILSITDSISKDTTDVASDHIAVESANNTSTMDNMGLTLQNTTDTVAFTQSGINATTNFEISADKSLTLKKGSNSITENAAGIEIKTADGYIKQDGSGIELKTSKVTEKIGNYTWEVHTQNNIKLTDQLSAIELPSDGTIKFVANKNTYILNPEGPNLNNHRIIYLKDPQDPQDAANKQYVDAHSGGGQYYSGRFVIGGSGFDFTVSAPAALANGITFFEFDCTNIGVKPMEASIPAGGQKQYSISTHSGTITEPIRVKCPATTYLKDAQTTDTGIVTISLNPKNNTMIIKNLGSKTLTFNYISGFGRAVTYTP